MEMSEEMRRVRDREARIGHAVRTGDDSALTSAIDRCAYSWRLSRLGQWDRAEAVARSIEDDDDERGQALAILAQDLARAGLLERAETVARSIQADSPFGAVQEKMVALIAVARGLAEQGQPERARSVIRHAQAAAAALREEAIWEEADGHLLIGEIFMVLGLRDEALASWQEAAACARPAAHVDMDCAKILRAVAANLEAAGLTGRRGASTNGRNVG